MSVGIGDPAPFRLDDELPGGVTLLEASAGTGKTYTIAALAVRYLADGLPVDKLLVVTFTRSATGELRDRVRSRLVSAEAGLRAALAGEPPAGDELVDLLRLGDPDAVAARQACLAAAVADFDAATIATIHGFCEQVLGGLGTAADCGRDLRFVEDDAEIIDEVVDDFYLRKFAGTASPGLTRAEARRIVGAAVHNRDAWIEPSSPGARPADALRASLAVRGRAEVLRRSRTAGTITYDDQLHRLRDSLTGPSGEAAARRLRERFAVVLVDEFQDTDPVQWDIFRTAFAGTGTPLLLIGDPKQAIYSFRGADVLAYLDAAASAGSRSTLGTNWRSDQPLVDACNALLGGATLGHDGIPYRHVDAAPDHQASALAGAPDPAALRLRLVHRDDGGLQLTKPGYAQADSAREAVAADLAADIVGLLSSGATLPGRDGERRAAEPGDLAVLVRANYEATIVHRALDAAGLPAVIAGGGSVFATPSGADWLTLLEALEQPAATARARAAALTPFKGWDARQLVTAGDSTLDGLQATLHRWASVLDTSGVAALMATISAEERLVARELARAGGERRLTDVHHVAELLHAEALATGAGGRSLTAWLRERIADAGTDTGGDERSRRLDSDAAAVQILTVHRSKGLEYPVVYLPYLWLSPAERADRLPLFHDPSHGDRRCLDVSESGPTRLDHEALADEEQFGEELRQTYVALTRARHQVTVWWATGQNSGKSPLGRLLIGRQPDGAVASRPPASVPKHDDVVWAAMTALVQRAPGRISATRVGTPAPAPWQPPPAAERELEVRRFERPLDTTWRRASYTAITAAAHGAAGEPAVGSEPDAPGVADEADVLASEGVAAAGGAAAPVDPDLAASRSPMADLPAGAGFGILVHAVFEAVDFAAEDLDGELAAAVAGAVGRLGAAGGPDPAVLAGALRAVIDTPLGPLAAGLRLRDLARADRLDELAFELPVAGGDQPSGEVPVGAIAATLRRWLPAGDPLAAYPDRLDDPAVAQVLRGYLTGSIDLVARLTPGERYVVVDYKTNWLGPPGEDLSAWHYRPERMAEAMLAEHYPLQAVLYSVALHRYLRWRRPGYDPARHLGGVLYLFVRGMAGPATPAPGGTPCGVFSWTPPPEMVVALSDLLDLDAPVPDGRP